MSPEPCEYVPLVEAWRLFPHTPTFRFSHAAMWNWVSRGIRVGRELVRLRGVRVGRQWFTTEQWADEFMQSYRAVAKTELVRRETIRLTSGRTRRVRTHDEATFALAEDGI